MTKVNCVIFSFPISSESILTGLRQGVIQKFGGQHSCSPSFFDIRIESTPVRALWTEVIMIDFDSEMVYHDIMEKDRCQYR